MTAGRPHIAQAHRALNEDRLAEIDYRIGTGNQAHDIEERLIT